MTLPLYHTPTPAERADAADLELHRALGAPVRSVAMAAEKRANVQ